MLLIISTSRDEHLPFVTKHLDEKNVVFLLTDRIPDESLFTLSPDHLIASLNMKQISLDSISAVWYRKPQAITIDGFDEKLNAFVAREWQMFLRSLYSCLSHAFWVNPIPTNTLTNAKLLQLKVAKQLGFTIPETIFTNNKEDALAFARKHKEVALKVIDQVVIENQGSERYMYTKRLSHEDLSKLDGFQISPVILQEYIPKAYEVRVTCVGDTIFSCRIDSQTSNEGREDWRNGMLSEVTHTPINLPVNVEDKLRKMMRYYQLQYGAFDIIVTPDNQYVFLEVNPNGQWAWIEIMTKMQIGCALATLLIQKGGH